MMAEHGHDEHGHGHSAHPAIEVIKHPAPLEYWKTFWFLMVMLVVTVALYWFDISKSLGWVGWNLVVAMVVATSKAYAVVRNFMNVKGSTRLTFFWAVLGFIWFLFLFGIFIDYRSRPSQGGWENAFIRY
jgi:cytochrome c oxidase subunit IV